MIDVEFTGSESPAEIVKAAIDVFSQQPPTPHVTILYENAIPRLRYEYQGGDIEFSCTYRLDAMLLPFYGEAERVFDEIANIGAVDIDLRELLVRYIAFGGMVNLLSRLLSLQLDIFKEAFAEQRLVSRALFLQAVLKTRVATKDRSLAARAISKNVKRWVNQVIDEATKKKRDFLVGFMNAQPLMHIPTSAGRPEGSTKSEKKKAQDKSEFEAKIEETIRALYAATGTFPTKTAVAESLSSGPNALRVFIAKTNRQNIDYDALAERVKGSLNN